MERIEVKEYISARSPETVIEDGAEFLEIVTEPEKALDLIGSLKNDTELAFDTLACLTATDWISHFFVTYHLFSRKNRQTLVVKVKVTDRETPAVDSVYDLWNGAELLECEVYDMFGIGFNEHPRLRRLFLDENWQGYPLRKDYQDEINMISW